MSHIHAYHIGTAVLVLVGIICMYMARDFLKQVLSEKDPVTGVCFGSHKRVIEFFLIITMCYCEIFHTLKKGELDYQHLVTFFVAAILYAGITNIKELSAAWKGQTITSQTVDTPNKTIETVQAINQPA